MNMSNSDFLNMVHLFFLADEDDVVGLCGLYKESDDHKLDEATIKRYMYPWFIFIIAEVKV